MKYIAITIVALALAAPTAPALAQGGNSENGLVFTGYDPVLGIHVRIEKSGGVYMMDGMAMEVRRHPNIPDRGISLAIVDRVGKPDNYFVLHRQGELSIYVDCEFGPCRYKRSIMKQ